MLLAPEHRSHGLLVPVGAVLAYVLNSQLLATVGADVRQGGIEELPLEGFASNSHECSPDSRSFEPPAHREADHEPEGRQAYEEDDHPEPPFDTSVIVVHG